MADVKMTKKIYFEKIRDIILDSNTDDVNDLVEFLDKQIDILNIRSEKARAYAASKKAEEDVLRNTIAAMLTDEFQTIDTITAQINDDNITKAKVTARLNQLVKSNKACKDIIKIGNRKLTAYKLA